MQRDQNTVDDSASYDEALRLTLAFYCIMEPDKRAIILALAERYAERQPPVVEKAIHRER